MGHILFHYGIMCAPFFLNPILFANASPEQKLVSLPRETTTKLTEQDVLNIHSAMHHGENTRVVINNSTYQIHTSTRTGVKYVCINGYKLLQQNPERRSFYAFKAKAGSKIPWIVHPNKKRSWGLVENGLIVKF